MQPLPTLRIKNNFMKKELKYLGIAVLFFTILAGIGIAFNHFPFITGIVLIIIAIYGAVKVILSS